MFSRRALSEESKRCPHPFASLALIEPPPLRRYAQRRKAESRSGDAGHAPVRFVVGRPICSDAIQHKTGSWISLLPEIQEGAVRKILQKSILDLRE